MKQYNETGFWGTNFGTMLITDKDNRIVGEIKFFKRLTYLEGYEINYLIYKKDDRGKVYATGA